MRRRCYLEIWMYYNLYWTDFPGAKKRKGIKASALSNTAIIRGLKKNDLLLCGYRN